MTPSSPMADSHGAPGTPAKRFASPADPVADEYELTVVMPCLNEAETLERCICKAQDWMASRGVRGEVVIGDNGSTDGSIGIAERLGARVVHVTQRGYGAALDAAVRSARGRYVIMGDSDDSYDFSSLDPFMEKLRENWDLVMGNRFLGGIHPGAMPWKNRYIGNPALSWLGRTLFGIRLGDFHCGIRGFNRASYERLNLATTGMEFASEMVIKAQHFNLRSCEVATTLAPDGRSRPPHLRPWRDGWRHLRFMLLFAPRWLFFYPGIILAGVGAALATPLLRGPLRLGNVTFDIHSLLLASLAMIIGFQAMTFGILGKLIAIRLGAHPVTARSDYFNTHFSVEIVSLLGAAMSAAGAVVLGGAVMEWWRSGFGPLDPTETMRRAIPGSTLVVLGLQTVLAALLVGVIRLPVRTATAMAPVPER